MFPPKENEKDYTYDYGQCPLHEWRKEMDEDDNGIILCETGESLIRAKVKGDTPIQQGFWEILEESVSKRRNSFANLESVANIIERDIPRVDRVIPTRKFLLSDRNKYRAKIMEKLS